MNEGFQDKVALIWAVADLLRGDYKILQDRRGAIIPSLNTANVANLCVVCPPLREQPAPLRSIEATATRFSDALSKVRTQRDLLREYQQSLVTTAVTGHLNIAAAKGKQYEP